MEENYLKEIGNRLLECRVRRELSRKDVARLAGIPTATVQQMENGELDVGIEAASKICKALNCSADYLFTGELGIREWIDLTRKMVNFPEQDDANLKKIFRTLWETAPKYVRSL